MWTCKKNNEEEWLDEGKEGGTEGGRERERERERREVVILAPPYHVLNLKDSRVSYTVR
jgi:hypothetical protein